MSDHLDSESRQDFRLPEIAETLGEFRDGKNTCVSCHHLPDFGNTAFAPTAPSLRNRSYSKKRLWQLLQDDTHKHLRINKNDTDSLHAFLLLLADVPDEKFRELILKATVLDTSGDLK